MKFLKELGIIMGISFAGEVIAKLLYFPIPASIYGMILMLLLLQSKVLKITQISEVSSLLLAIMPVLFVPAGVGLMEELSQIREYSAAIILIIIVTTGIVMLATGKTAEIILHLHRRKKK